jgi:glycosyltransferase involved in cell wall biosynthesis
MSGPKFVIARWLQRMLLSEFGSDARDVWLVPNGVDWKQFHVPEKLGLCRPKDPVVGFCYSRWRWKGCDTALKALRIVQREIPSLKVISFGGAPLRVTDRRPNNFSLTIAPSQSKIPDLYLASQLWILPSVLEGFGMPGLEAMACWRPVVATACGGAEDYICNGKNGWLVPVADARSMAERILQILHLPDQQWGRMASAAHQSSLSFDWDKSAALLDGAIHACFSRKSPALEERLRTDSQA